MKTKSLLTSLFLFVITIANAQMDDKFYQPSKTMKPWEFTQAVETISFPVESDTITAYVVKPTQKQNGKTIVFFHGAGGNVSTYQYITKPLVESGYQVFMVDVRGYGKSTGKPTHLNVAEDSQKLFDSILMRNDVKNTKIYIYGASLGTQVSTLLAKNNSTKLAGLILDGPMESFTEIAIHFAPQYADMIRNYIHSPYSAGKDLSEVTIPKLIITTKDDQTVPYVQQSKVYEIAAEPKKRFESTGDHLQGLVNDRDALLKAINNL